MSLATRIYEGTWALGQESDDIVSLPAPPPPNPAARRAAIDTAMRKFDGIEDAAPKRASARPGLLGWASSHRRATGGLVTAALIAVVGLPAIQVALRNQPQAETASERAAPGLPTADVESVQDNAAAAAAAPPAEPASDQLAPNQSAPIPIASNEPVAAPAEPALAKEERRDFAASRPEQKARAATAAPMLSAPAPLIAPASPPAPPPPPPPPAPMAEREAADAVATESGNIVVTGSSISRQNMKSAAPASVVTAEQAYADFHEKLSSAFQANNHKAILGLIGYPLKVDFDGDVRTYRTRSEVERDYDRIFTTEVRASVLGGQASRHLTFAPICARQPCASGSIVKVRAVSP